MAKFNDDLKQLNFCEIERQILTFWKDHDIFKKSVAPRPAGNNYVLYEIPFPANEEPAIKHIRERTVKDLFCRYQTMKGKHVIRRYGWGTNNISIEFSVEKKYGITKDDIGSKISIDEYYSKCRETAMQHKDQWDDITQKMGFWLGLDNPYITFNNEYIESVWWLLAQLYDKKLLYKGYTIQPYSPAAGKGLSSNELNQPGCYRDVTDTTEVAQFLTKNESLPSFLKDYGDVYILAWTKTPWTFPSNTALTVGPKIDYVLIKTYNQYTFKPISVILAKALVKRRFAGKFEMTESIDYLMSYQSSDKKIPYFIVTECKGQDLEGIRYEQLLKYALPYQNPENAFRVICGNFVTTADGTGVVHTAPTFGADDAKVAKETHPEVPPLLVLDENNEAVPLVDLQGRFRTDLTEIGGKYVKNAFYPDGEAPERSIDVEISFKLMEENKAFKVEKYVHAHPHCWRTDKPLIYYPLETWIIRSTVMKDKMIELSKLINWKPKYVGKKHFAKYLEDISDQNLSRSGYWGIPLPIWRNEDTREEICIESLVKLALEITKANQILGLNQSVPKDLSRPNIDAIILVSPSGKPMMRVFDLIEDWFDFGSMPFASIHYPMENTNFIDKGITFPSDFIADGVDQIQGSVFNFHAIASMVFEKVAYRNAVSNGLVFAKNGYKISKRMGNLIDPFDTIATYGIDAIRWYMISNAQPWDNLKIDLEGIDEVRRKFFGTLFNSYSFFSLYANIDGFTYKENHIPLAERQEIDRWIISLLNSLVKDVTSEFADYEPTNATRKIMTFVDEHLSNWYVRLCRRRFWKGDYSEDKIAAYQTFYECLSTLSKLMAPVAPMFADWLYKNLNDATQKENFESVHLTYFPEADLSAIDKDLEQKMDYAKRISSLVFSIRKKNGLPVRQPLTKILLPVLDPIIKSQIDSVKDLILSEVNVKEIEYPSDTKGYIRKKAIANFKTLGKILGKNMKAGASIISKFDMKDIVEIEKNNQYLLEIEGDRFMLTLKDVKIIFEEIPGYQVAADKDFTVALDIVLSDDLIAEGITRELVCKIQKMRKSAEMDFNKKINIVIEDHDLIRQAVEKHGVYIKNEVRGNSIKIQKNVIGSPVFLKKHINLNILITK